MTERLYVKMFEGTLPGVEEEVNDFLKTAGAGAALVSAHYTFQEGGYDGRLRAPTKHGVMLVLTEKIGGAEHG